MAPKPPAFVIDDSKKTKAAESTPAKNQGLEIGESGTQIFGGVINEEYNAKLQGTTGIEVYDEMRKSDGTVAAAVKACSLPIRRAKWFIKPASEEKADIEIADFVRYALFEAQSIKWNDILRQSLLMLPLGVMVFEKVYKVASFNGKDRVLWDKFAPRLPKSIQAWETTDKKPGIQQRTVSGGLASIPMEKLIVLVNDREGDNWWGSSILRAPYKHWYIKNTLYKIDAIAAERQGLGVPKVKLPEGFSEEDRAKAETILKNLRANEHAYIIEPHDYEITFMDMMAKTTRDVTESINHHNREITKSVLAQFLELGSTDSGSRALSTDQTDMFLQSEEAAANTLVDAFNVAIQEIVNLNFDGTERYPELAYTGITRTNVANLASAYQTLTTAKGLKPGPNDEVYLRELLGLPERDQSEDVDEDVDEDDADDGDDDADAQMNKAGKKEASEHRHASKKKIYAEGDEWKGWRALTFAERKVNFGALEAKLDTLEDSFDKVTQGLLHTERDRFITSLTKALNNGDRDAVKAATLKIKDAYARIIKDSAREAFEYGKTTAAREMGSKIPTNPREVLSQIDIQADAIADLHITQITAEAKTSMVNALSKGESAAVALAAADKAASQLIDDLTYDTSRILMAGSVNNGRSAAFDANSENIYALQRSEILDSSTCNYCLSIDGRIVEKDDPFAENTIFHSNCRGIWVEILLSEEELPSIGGIPQSLRDRFGDATNDLLQPRVPQTRKNTLARKEVERRAKRDAKRKQE